MSTFTGFKDYPDNSTPLSAEFLNALLDKMYPLGKVEVFFDNLDHSDYLGFTWERTCIGRTPVGIDTTQTEFDTIGETGGSKELQAHTHEVYSAYGQGTSTKDALLFGTSAIADEYRYYGYGFTNFIKDAGTGNSGNLQPYQVVAFWKRVEASE